MTSTTRTTRTSPAAAALLEQLEQAYMAVYSGFAVDVSEVAADLQVSKNRARKLLHMLQAQRLVEGHDLNEEAQGSRRRGQFKEILWQCWETYDSATEEQARETFRKAFNITGEPAATAGNSTTTTEEVNSMAKTNDKGEVTPDQKPGKGSTSTTTTAPPAPAETLPKQDAPAVDITAVYAELKKAIGKAKGIKVVPSPSDTSATIKAGKTAVGYLTPQKRKQAVRLEIALAEAPAVEGITVGTHDNPPSARFGLVAWLNDKAQASAAKQIIEAARDKANEPAPAPAPEAPAAPAAAEEAPVA